MSFIHDNPEFDDLLQIVATDRNLALGLVEKDYWVTHTLWALHVAGFEVWFKGGTSLSKGFGLIERFSEDLDLKVEPGTVRSLPTVSNWKGDGTKATAERENYFERLASSLLIAGAEVALDRDNVDPSWRGANIRVTYPGRYIKELGVLAPFVRLEVGTARVTPFVPRDMTSFVHEKLIEIGQLGDFEDNRPRAVRCVHPFVTLVEKLDAIHRRFPKERVPAPDFVRHFEDAARIIGAASRLPVLEGYADVRALAEDMLTQKPRQIDILPAFADPAFAPDDSLRWGEIRAAYEAIAPMFWGSRIPLDDACARIREWIAGAFGERAR